ncbi:CHASE3 domain-containing protein [Embleya sp. NPDC050493]|uniref:sensor histidine kinase n=1 Tax=Embleya sp. NPDC050493 TaxID=3363989 RepID=UPI00378D0894
MNTTEPSLREAPRSAPRAHWTTRHWLMAGVSISLAVLAVLAGTGVWVFAHSTAISKRLVDGSSPALIDAVRLEAALVNQETGVRGYELTGRPEFLAPYTAGLAEQADAARDLARHTRDDDRAAADLARVLEHAGQWRAVTADPVVNRPAGAPAPADLVRVDQGKAAFDALRRALGDQRAHLQADRDGARGDLIEARTMRNWVFTAIGALILLLAGLVFAALRRGVTAPLEHLTHQAHIVTEGGFEHPLTGTGPADLRALADRMEAMRRRLVDELARADRTRAQLAEQAEDLRRSNAELEQFAYVASHDLQEPLRKITSFCQLLQRRYGGQLDDRADQYIAYAVDGATRMQTLINDLLAFSRVGRLHQETEPVDLEALWSGATDTLSLAIEEADAEITHDPLPTLTGNRSQLDMLLHNLLGNAIKFRHPDRTARVHLSVERDDSTGDQDDGVVWRFALTDNGIGIEPEYAERVFVIFQRLHTREAYTGNGIGLAMCKKIVEFHGGTITVDPQHTPGARIAFTLPDPPRPAPPREVGPAGTARRAVAMVGG